MNARRILAVVSLTSFAFAAVSLIGASQIPPIASPAELAEHELAIERVSKDAPQCVEFARHALEVERSLLAAQQSFIRNTRWGSAGFIWLGLFAGVGWWSGRRVAPPN